MEFDERVPNSVGFRATSRFLKKCSEVSEIPTGSIWFHHKCCGCANRNDTMVSWRNRARNLDIPIGILMFLKCSGWPCPFYAPCMPLVCPLYAFYAPCMPLLCRQSLTFNTSTRNPVKFHEVPWSPHHFSRFQENSWKVHIPVVLWSRGGPVLETFIFL